MKDDITNAVNAGKVVTVSKTNINFNGWNGCGYIITNPETGAGGYMISGGTNGGWFDWVDFSHRLAWGGFFIIGLLAAVFLPFWFGLLCTVMLSIFGNLVQGLIREGWGLDPSMNVSSYSISFLNITSQTTLAYLLTLSIGYVAVGAFAPLFAILSVFIVLYMLVIDLYTTVSVITRKWMA